MLHHHQVVGAMQSLGLTRIEPGNLISLGHFDMNLMMNVFLELVQIPIKDFIYEIIGTQGIFPNLKFSLFSPESPPPLTATII